jgi:hypothetical protein
MPFNQAATSNTESFLKYEDCHFRPDPDPESPIVEPDPFADRQIDAMVEGIEMRSARSFDSAVEASAVPTRRSMCSRSTHGTPDFPGRRRYPRPMASLLLATLAIFGLLVALFISDGSQHSSPSLKIKTTAPSTPSYPTIEQSPPPTRHPTLRPVKMPRQPQPPALLASTDPTPPPANP